MASFAEAPAAGGEGDDSWKEKLTLPKKDTRVQTAVSARL